MLGPEGPADELAMYLFIELIAGQVVLANPEELEIESKAPASPPLLVKRHNVGQQTYVHTHTHVDMVSTLQMENNDMMDMLLDQCGD